MTNSRRWGRKGERVEFSGLVSEVRFGVELMECNGYNLEKVYFDSRRGVYAIGTICP